MKITGTFIDEISHYITSANWHPQQWSKYFDSMKAIGIDTVIIIRAGYKNRMTFNSKAIRRDVGRILPVPYDLVELFLTEAERCDMDLFFGTYDSGRYWMEGNYQREVDINKALAKEVVAKYGHRKAFKGWYISHEIDTYNETALKVYQQLAKYLKGMKDLPTLISPYIHGKKQFVDDPVTLEHHVREWDQIFGQIKAYVDIVAVQDGNVDFHELSDYICANSKLARRHGLTCWSNAESFSRDTPIKFPPIGWPELLSKITAASSVPDIEKLITFEFSHFMSPNSTYIAAHNLYKRYCEWLGRERK